MSDMTQREVFAANLNKLMHSRGLDQIDIVRRLDVTASTVSDWANGKKYPRVDAMQKLADLFGVRMSDLMSDDIETSSDNYLDEDEREIVAIFRRLDRRQKHEMMSMIYAFERSTDHKL